MRIRLGAALLIAALVALLVASSATPAPGDPRRVHNAADQKLATSLVLSKTDLPAGTWAVSRVDTSGPNPPCVLQNYRLDAFTETGEMGWNYANSSAGIHVESDASIYLNVAQARQIFAQASKLGFIRCFVSSIRGVTIKKLERIKSGATGVASNAYDVSLSVRVSNRTVPVDIVSVQLQRGRAISGLSVAQYGQALSARLVASLVAHAAQRLRTH